MTQDKPTIEDVIDKYPQFSRRDFGLSGNDEPDYISIDSAKAAMTEYASLKNKKANEFICDIAKLLGEDNLGLDDCQWSIDDFKEAIASLNRQGWGEWQRCPVCDGNGQILADGFISSVYQTCPTCSGQRIIQRPFNESPIEPCATSSENYWKQRCEAAEVILASFPTEVLKDQAGEDYHPYEQLKTETSGEFFKRIIKDE